MIGLYCGKPKPVIQKIPLKKGRVFGVRGLPTFRGGEDLNVPHGGGGSGKKRRQHHLHGTNQPELTPSKGLLFERSTDGHGEIRACHVSNDDNHLRQTSPLLQIEVSLNTICNHRVAECPSVCKARQNRQSQPNIGSEIHLVFRYMPSGRPLSYLVLIVTQLGWAKV